MNRRQLLKLLTSGVVGLSADIDLDQLLWVPNQKTIFIPSTPKLEVIGRPLTIEMMDEVIKKIYLKNVHLMFERDDMFYKNIIKRETIRVSTREMRIPLILKPGKE